LEIKCIDGHWSRWSWLVEIRQGDDREISEDSPWFSFCSMNEKSAQVVTMSFEGFDAMMSIMAVMGL